MNDRQRFFDRRYIFHQIERIFILHRDDLVYAEILAPDNTPDFLIKSSNDLWNYVEKTEKRKDARTAKEFKITLPCELTNEQNIKLLREYLKKNFTDKGIICDFVIHNDKDNKNPHAHVMITTREITPTGFGKKGRNILCSINFKTTFS